MGFITMILLTFLHLSSVVSLSTSPQEIGKLAISCDDAKKGHPPYPDIAHCVVIQNRDLPRDPGDLSDKPTWSARRPTKAIYQVPRRFHHRTCAAEITLSRGVAEEKGYWSDATPHFRALDASCWAHHWPPPKADFLGGSISFGDHGHLHLRFMYNGPTNLGTNGTLR